MNGETERIIQVSLSKITDCRRRRGTTLRRSLFVSNVLNNVLTSSDSPYGHYRTPKDTDVDYDGLEAENMCLDRPVQLRDDSGGSGNVQEIRNASNIVAETKVLCEKPLVENQPIVKGINRDIDSKHSSTNRSCSNAVISKETNGKVVTGSKRPRSHANETCESHAVSRKRHRSESNKADNHEAKDTENIEPMDISGLVSVFSSSFTGLSGFSSSATSNNFSCLEPVRSVSSLQFGGAWQHTVAAF